MSEPTASGSVIIAYGTLVINGPGTITGGNTTGTGGGVWARGGSVTLGSGAITDNNAKTSGGGVYVSGSGGTEAAAIGGGRTGSGGTVTIKGGAVTAVGGEDDPGLPNDYVYDIGVKGGSTTTVTYTDDSAAGMSVTANKYVGTVKLSKPFYNIDTLARLDRANDADKNALSGTLVPVVNYCTVTFGSGSGSGEMANALVLTGSEYTLPECTFTPPASLRPFVDWLVKIGDGQPAILKPGDTITVTDDTTANARYATEYGELQTLINNASNGETITLGRDYVSESGSDTVFTVPAGKAVTVDLAGHRIDRGRSTSLAGENCNVFTVYGNLTVCDTSEGQGGSITGGNNTGGGGAVRVLEGGTFTFAGGTITGNKSPNGGAIYNIGTVSISGGVITNNTATNSGGDIFNNNSGTLNLTGGTITGNSAGSGYHGGGIHTSGTLNVSGSPTVSGNTRGGTANNIGLYEGAIITVSGTLGRDAVLDLHDRRISPIYGYLKGIRNVTVFAGTDGILYPDITKFFRMLDDDPSNELIVAQDMNHVYPLFPIPEARSAVDKIIRIVAR